MTADLYLILPHSYNSGQKSSVFKSYYGCTTLRDIMMDMPDITFFPQYNNRRRTALFTQSSAVLWYYDWVRVNRGLNSLHIKIKWEF